MIMIKIVVIIDNCTFMIKMIATIDYRMIIVMIKMIAIIDHILIMNMMKMITVQ